LLLEDLEDLGWIDTRLSKPSPSSDISYEEIYESQALYAYGYTEPQAAWIKSMLFEQYKVVDIDLESSRIQFVGYGRYLNPRAVGDYSDSSAYQRFKQY